MIAYALLCFVYILKSEERTSLPPFPSATQLLSAHRMLTHPVLLADCEMWSESQSFTASRHLWEANSSVEFYRAWREKPQYWIENLVFKDFWMYGRPADLDEFTRLMLTSYVPFPPLFMERRRG